jgi:capsular polysaccharide transport system permease protein
MSQNSIGHRRMPSVSVTSLRSIIALMLREMSTRYGRTPGGYLWAILEPLGMIIILSFAWSLLARSPSMGTSFLLFKGTGYLVLQTFTTLGGQVGHALTFSKQLLRYPRVTWVDAIAARFTLNALVVFTVTFIILSGIIIYEDIDVVLGWGPILLAMFFAAGLGLGVGCLNAFLFMRFPVWLRWSCFFDQIAAQLRWIRVSSQAAILMGSVWLAWTSSGVKMPWVEWGRSAL